MFIMKDHQPLGNYFQLQDNYTGNWEATRLGKSCHPTWTDFIQTEEFKIIANTLQMQTDQLIAINWSQPASGPKLMDNTSA